MFSTTLKEELRQLVSGEAAFDLPLGAYTSLHIGGPADALVWPLDTEMLRKVTLWARGNKIPVFVLGKGSNTLVKDGGFRGVVLLLNRGFKQVETARQNGHYTWVYAEAGVPTQQMLRWCIDQGLKGFEKLAGIPGTLGGNIVMNAGTHLGTIGELVETVTFCDAKGNVQTLEKEKLTFEYRKSSIPSSGVVLHALLKLEKGEKEALEKEVRKVFEKRGLEQPVELPNIGSVFKNPGLPAGRQGKKKAWELIEEAGLKGVRVGKARVSEKHANFIVNEGGATARDVLVLIDLIRDKVREVSGIGLEMEIKVIGEENV